MDAIFIAIPHRKLAMAQQGASSGGRLSGSGSSAPRKQVADPYPHYPYFGEESGLPLIVCPYCKRARVIERHTQQDSATNYGRIYIKCARNEKWVSFTLAFRFRLFDLAKIDFLPLIIQLPEQCDYYRWQKAYFLELIEANQIQLCLSEEGRDEGEVQSARRNVQQKQHLEAKVEQMMYGMVFLGVVVVGLMGVLLGYMLKK
jgi:hypothetical protein